MLVFSYVHKVFAEEFPIGTLPKINSKRKAKKVALEDAPAAADKPAAPADGAAGADGGVAAAMEPPTDPVERSIVLTKTETVGLLRTMA